MTIKELIIVGYGGLRGALALALGLIVYEDEANFPDRTRDLVKFHVVGVVILTLLINGTTTGWVMKKFGVIENLDQREDFK